MASSLTSVSFIYSHVRFSATGRLSFHFKAHGALVAGREAERAAAQRLERLSYRLTVETKAARLTP